MKVAYNRCYGGFSLSPVALTEFAKRKGINLTWYNRTVFSYDTPEYVRINGIPKSGSINYCPLTKDCGEIINKIDNDVYYCFDRHEDNLRADIDLIAVIEELGDKANGPYAEIAIEEIPDDAEFEIEEYDGSESVVPPRQSW